MQDRIKTKELRGNTRKKCDRKKLYYSRETKRGKKREGGAGKHVKLFGPGKQK